MKQKISSAELTIMETLWDDNPLAASDVADRLPPDTGWSIRTVKTLLSRLVDKGALATEPDGRRFLYSPLVSRKDYASKQARTLSNRLFGGRAAPLVAHLAESGGLTDDDIADLEAIIQELKNER